MAPISGKYQLERNENLAEYLVQLGKCERLCCRVIFIRASGFPEAAARKADGLKPMLEIEVEDGRYTFQSKSGTMNSTTSFALNEMYEEKMPNGNVLQV